MDGQSLFCVSILMHICVVNFVTSSYVHEASYMTIKPAEIDQKDFGFSMAYKKRDRDLVIGAPHNDLYGQIYSCSLQDISKNETTCSKVDMQVEVLAKYTRRDFTNQQFCMGASIAATSDYFFACAPLWTAEIKKKTKSKLFGAYGTCFLYNGTTHRYFGLFEQYLRKPFSKPEKKIYGGTGWTTLADEINNKLLMTKISLRGDITWVPLDDPLKPVQSLWQIPTIRDYFNGFENIGYALAVGNFFMSNMVYAFSMKKFNIGVVAFLNLESLENTYIVKRNNGKELEISHESLNSLFGASLCAADVNLDGVSDLLVGAPAQGDDLGAFETGAVHIYLGGDLETINDRKRMRSILGKKDGARFGATIATNDIDGDGFPEIFISAPYEDLGIGALYILLGSEVSKELIIYDTFKEIHITKLKQTQRVQNAANKQFGYSLKIIPDLDDNGCNEVAIGSPGSASAALFRCVPTVDVNVTAKLVDVEIVREQDNNFTVRVCVEVVYPLKPDKISTKLMVYNAIVGDGAYIPTSKQRYDIDLSSKVTTFCEDVIVKLSNNEPGYYEFTTKILNEDIWHIKDFDNKWVTMRINPYNTKTEAKVEITRRCRGNDCVPKLSMNLTWTGKDVYVLGSTNTETVSVRVSNAGNSSYEACAWVQVVGAPVARIECPDYDAGYRCYLPKPLRRNDKYDIEIVLDMNKVTNIDEKLQVKAMLYKNCDQSDAETTLWDVPFIVNTEDVSIIGLSHDRNITDRAILYQESTTFEDEHEYVISNNGSVTWIDIVVVLLYEKKPFINQFYLITGDTKVCPQQDFEDMVIFNCTIKLMPNSTFIFIGTAVVAKDKIMDNLVDGKLGITSNLTIYLEPTSVTKEKRLTSVMTFQKELSAGQNKTLIMIVAIVIAIFILGFVVFALYKANFFKRKDKTKLDELKQEIRRQSFKRSASVSNEPQSGDRDSIQLVDCLFVDTTADPVMQTTGQSPEACDTNKAVVNVEDAAQVH